MNSLKLSLETLLNNTPAKSLDQTLQQHACVSLLLRGDRLDNLELAFIERALRPNDRWSGQIAFPGGRRESTDPTHLAAAIRETSEEVNITLTDSELIGTLSDIQARKRGQLLDFYIRPFVFYVNRPTIFYGANEEVADFFWVKMNSIIDQNNRTTYSQYENGQLLTFPAVDLRKNLPLWGLSYMITLNLLQSLFNDSIKDNF